ncbi:hypothetical protein SAMN05216421_1090 [Halopseudomonas xinjiangensis]|uniref:Uncharacterized protein n=1 Tax=Halopseudomonas xinjiangensis TaxID=487184 RepID=A0A1H1QBS0_9GAMM|nr:hypothetical protein [Halopseudomonas xinjiangensis]SDS20329.1 hypothetical protein SAMN05216421_1090 [Halopseudomonas xinjiangensis]
MSHQFKAGDLALTLVENKDWPAGCVVSLYLFVPEGSTVRAPNGVFHMDRACWVCTREGHDYAQEYSPNQLMPLRGDFQPEREKAQEVPV